LYHKAKSLFWEKANNIKIWKLFNN